MRKDLCVSSRGEEKDPESLHPLIPAGHSNDEGQISLDAYRGNIGIIVATDYWMIHTIAKATQDISEERCRLHLQQDVQVKSPPTEGVSSRSIPQEPEWDISLLPQDEWKGQAKYTKGREKELDELLEKGAKTSQLMKGKNRIGGAT